MKFVSLVDLIQMIAAQMGHPSRFVEFKTGPGVPSELQSSVTFIHEVTCLSDSKS